MKEHEIKLIVDGVVHETIKRIIHKGNVCIDGKWYEVKDGGIHRGAQSACGI